MKGLQTEVWTEYRKLTRWAIQGLATAGNLCYPQNDRGREDEAWLGSSKDCSHGREAMWLEPWPCPRGTATEKTITWPKGMWRINTPIFPRQQKLGGKGRDLSFLDTQQGKEWQTLQPREHMENNQHGMWLSQTRRGNCCWQSLRRNLSFLGQKKDPRRQTRVFVALNKPLQLPRPPFYHL